MVSGLSSHSKEQADAHTPEPTTYIWLSSDCMASYKRPEGLDEERPKHLKRETAYPLF